MEKSANLAMQSQAPNLIQKTIIVLQGSVLHLTQSLQIKVLILISPMMFLNAWWPTWEATANINIKDRMEPQPVSNLDVNAVLMEASDIVHYRTQSICHNTPYWTQLSLATVRTVTLQNDPHFQHRRNVGSVIQVSYKTISKAKFIQTIGHLSLNQSRSRNVWLKSYHKVIQGWYLQQRIL